MSKMLVGMIDNAIPDKPLLAIASCVATNEFPRASIALLVPIVLTSALASIPNR